MVDFQVAAPAAVAAVAGKNLLRKFFPAGVDEHKKMEPLTGIEPATCSLRMSCSAS